jgi:hypothetical protein
MKVAVLTGNPTLGRMLLLEVTRAGSTVASPEEANLWLLDTDTPPKSIPRPPKGTFLVGLGNAESPHTVDVFLPLPYDTVKLEEILSATAARTKSESLSLTQIPGGLLIGQEKIALSPAEERIFTCLAERRGKTVTEEELLLACGKDVATTNVLQVHVYRLRRKIAKKTDANPIATVRGVGYYLK